MTEGAPTADAIPPAPSDQRCGACGELMPDPSRYLNRFCPSCGAIAATRGDSRSGNEAWSPHRASSGPTADHQAVVARGQRWSALIDRLESAWQSVRPTGRSGVLVAGALVTVAVVWFGSQVVFDDSRESATGQGADVAPDANADVEDEPSVDASSDTDEDESAALADPGEDLPLAIVRELPGSGPVIGQPLDSYLFIDQSSRLTRVDLETGDVVVYRTSSDVLGGSGHELLVESDDKIYAVSAEAPENESRFVVDLSGYGFEVSGAGMPPGETLVLADGRLAMTKFVDRGLDIDVVILVIDPVERTLVEIGQNESWWLWNPGLAFVPGAGAFEVSGDRPRFLVEGVPIVAGPNLVIARRCESPVSCRDSVLERATGEIVVDRLDGVPDEPWKAWFLNSAGDLLAVVDELDQSVAGPEIRLIEIETGDVIDLAWSLASAPNAVGSPENLARMIVASGDGRFVVRTVEDGLEYYDWEQNLTTTVPLNLGDGEGVAGGQLTLVPKGDQ